MDSPRVPVIAILSVFLSVICRAEAAPTSAPAALSREQRAEIARLHKAALGVDAAASADALKKLEDLGEPARSQLADAVRHLLATDRTAIERGVSESGDPARFHAVQEQIAALRQAARDNIDKLAHDETISIAHKNYAALQPLHDKLVSGLAPREALARAMSRRAELLSRWRQLVPANDNSFSEADEAKLAERAIKAAGLSMEQAAAIPEFGHGDPPAQALAHDIWYDRACRQIDAYNETLHSIMNGGEWDNFKRVNAYRECLGILPYELDPRLVNSARGHSKEMADLHYFSHESPVPASKTHIQRMQNAGYENGYGENIAMGSASGEQTFWMWFDSPGHHKNMAAPDGTALGVGEISVYWTQNTGTGKRLMLMSVEDRRKILSTALSARH